MVNPARPPGLVVEARRDEELGYRVRHNGDLIGWVKYDRDAPAGHWTGYCATSWRCASTGGQFDRQTAARELEDHVFIEHRR